MLDSGLKEFNHDTKTMIVTIPMEGSLLDKARKATKDSNQNEERMFRESETWKNIQEDILFHAERGSYSCILAIPKIAQAILRKEGFQVMYSGFSEKSTITWRD